MSSEAVSICFVLVNIRAILYHSYLDMCACVPFSHAVYFPFIVARLHCNNRISIVRWEVIDSCD